MRRRLTARVFATGAMGGVLFLAGAISQAGWLYVLAAGVLGLIAGSMFVRQHLQVARVARSVPARVRVGDEVRVGLEITNTSRKRLPVMRVTDHLAAFDRSSLASERIGPGTTAHVEQVRRAIRRGVFDAGPVVLRSGTPFGFLSTSRTVPVESPLTVVPRWADLTSFPILEPSSFPSDVLHERARTGAGEEYLGVRDYRPGDPPRSVHWRSTARAGHLVVREFEEEVASKVALVVAGADKGEPPDSALEVLVSAAASIAIYALQTGHPIEVTRYEQDGSAGRVDGPDRYAVLDWLAGVQPHDLPLTPLVGKALARIGRRGTVVLLAPTAGAAGTDLENAVMTVQAAGSRAIVVAARSSSWATPPTLLPGEESTLARLSAGRAPVKTISKGEDLFRCLSSLN